VIGDPALLTSRIEPAELLHRRVERADHLRLDRDVGWGDQRGTAGGANFAAKRLELVGAARD